MRSKLMVIIIILGITLPLFILVAMVLFVYPNNDDLIRFILKYRFLLEL